MKPLSLSPANLSSLFPRPDTQTRATQGEQLQNIAQGLRTGFITEKEAAGLLKEQEAIANVQREAMADGKLDIFERFHLAAMQGQAQSNIIDAHANQDVDFFAFSDGNVQRQAGQLDQIANGRIRNTITNSEAGKLLGHQAGISDLIANPNPWVGNILTDMQQNAAQANIDRHSQPGTQFDFKPFRPFGPIAG